jgi:uncharacterized protein DUF6152
MRKSLPLFVMLTAVSALGHHSYGDYNRDAPVALEGTVQDVLWGNPHVVITLQTENTGAYSVEWGSVFQLSRLGVKATPFKPGDHIIVTGSVNRNPEKHILTLVREISRPADGWRWADPRYHPTAK